MMDAGSVKSFGLLSAIVSSVFFYALSAAHAEVWVCTYTDGKNESAITKYQIEGDDLIETGAGLTEPAHFKIVLNNEFGVVAAYGIGARNPANQRAVVVGLVILINKERNVFKSSVTTLTADDGKPTSGTCIQN